MMRQKLHDLGWDKEKMAADAVRHELEEEKRLTARLKVCYELLAHCSIVKRLCFQKELMQKEQELKRAKSSVLDISGEDEEVLLKRIEMTESAHKEERNKSNLLEDVRTVLY